MPNHPGQPDEHDGARIPDVVLTILRYARAAGCDYVLVEADGYNPETRQVTMPDTGERAAHDSDSHGCGSNEAPRHDVQIESRVR